MGSKIFIRRVALRSYKSIAQCSVSLGALNYFVGQNGAGKSNFIDALRFVSDSLNKSLDHALRDRGGIDEVRRRSGGHPNSFGIRLVFDLGLGVTGHYSFQIGARAHGGYAIDEEECIMHGVLGVEDAYYRIKDGVVVASSAAVLPSVSPDRLFLVAASGLPEFRPLYDALSCMGFYNLNPEAIRELQDPDPGLVLSRDGHNLSAALDRLRKEKPESFEAIVQYLSKIVPGITGIEIVPLSRKMTLQFRQKVGANASPWRFIAENMSDGTLRVLGILTALFQFGGTSRKDVPLVGIEEPETAIHPGAAGILREAISLASQSTQVLVTSHSPELLDDPDLDAEEIFSVESKDGETSIGKIDESSKSILREKLFTAGELLKLGQLKADTAAIAALPGRCLELFGSEERHIE